MTPNGAAVAIVLRLEEGGFAPPLRHPFRGPLEVGVADLDGVGRDELLVLAYTGGQLRIYSASGP